MSVPTQTKKKFDRAAFRKMGFFELVRNSWTPYSKLFRYMKPYWWRFALGLGFGALAGAVSGVLPFVMKFVTEQIFAGGHGNLIKAAQQHTGPKIADFLLPCMAIPVAMLLRGLFSYLNSYYLAWVGLKSLNDLRADLFRHITHQSLAFFNTQRSGMLVSQVMMQTRMAQQALTALSSDLVKQPVYIFFGVSTLLALDWRFTIIALVLFPVCLLPMAIYGKKVRQSGKDEELEAGMMSVILTEALQGIRVVKSFARENYETQRFDDSNRAQFKSAMRVRKSMEIVGPLVEVAAAIGAGLALIYVYYYQIDAATFLALLMGLFLLYDPVKVLSRLHILMQKCLAATMSIFEMMEEEPTVQDVKGAEVLARVAGRIDFDNVTFQYAKSAEAALRNISLSIEPGKYYALVGASGAGKSTVLSMILRFYDPQEGVIRIDGKDLRSVTQMSLRSNIGVVTQDTFLFHDTIYDNILYGRLDATKEEVEAAARLAFAHDFIMAQPKGYETVVGDKGCLLSGGQQQRLAIARALLKDAPILLLDEATSALDSESERMIQQALETLIQGRTTIAIAHRLSTILKADCIVVMHQGQIMAAGTHTELLDRSPIYRKLYDLQFLHPNQLADPGDGTNSDGPVPPPGQTLEAAMPSA